MQSLGVAPSKKGHEPSLATRHFAICLIFFLAFGVHAWSVSQAVKHRRMISVFFFQTKEKSQERRELGYNLHRVGR